MTNRRCFVCGIDLRDDRGNADSPFGAMVRHLRDVDDFRHNSVSFVGPVVVEREAPGS